MFKIYLLMSKQNKNYTSFNGTCKFSLEIMVSVRFFQNINKNWKLLTWRLSSFISFNIKCYNTNFADLQILFRIILNLTNYLVYEKGIFKICYRSPNINNWLIAHIIYFLY